MCIIPKFRKGVKFCPRTLVKGKRTALRSVEIAQKL
jgi:hypothetical protein